LLASLALACSAPAGEADGTGATPLDLEQLLVTPEACAEVDAPKLRARLAETPVSSLPRRIDPGLLSGLEISWLAFALALPAGTVEKGLERDTVLARGALGVGVLASLAHTADGRLDRSLFEESLSTFYACSQRLPRTLARFVDAYGDYHELSTRAVVDSIPKPNARTLFEAPELGIYVSESTSEERGLEVEVILEGARDDGALEFITFDNSGNFSQTSLLRAGDAAATMSSPAGCITCHRSLITREVTIVDPTQF
jgi:hypothetical protein